jgi:putative transposase
MIRPLRLEFAGAIRHVTARGDRKEEIYLDDDDRVGYLELLVTRQRCPSRGSTPIPRTPR